MTMVMNNCQPTPARKPATAVDPFPVRLVHSVWGSPPSSRRQATLAAFHRGPPYATAGVPATMADHGSGEG
ncbi:MAG: hypothetical protein M0Z95_13785 [Actinomycetota bacterium]|nr:hypothetical protein [Actinomycetota bacterium]